MCNNSPCIFTGVNLGDRRPNRCQEGPL